jgi:uncharacterized membrane protein YgcG
MRGIDFNSWQGIFSTVLGLVLVTLVMVSIRLVFMQTIQRRRERENRQINERLRTLIAAYKTLGGSFTGNLEVDPAHRRDLRESGDDAAAPASERRRRIRDAVEAALSDILLLGTEEQVRLAARAANDLAAGRTVHVAELVVSLRDFIREVLDLGPMPPEIVLPPQGPLRPGGARGGGRGGDAGAARGGGEGGGRGSGGGGGGGGITAGGAGLGIGAALGDAHDDAR